MEGYNYCQLGGEAPEGIHGTHFSQVEHTFTWDPNPEVPTWSESGRQAACPWAEASLRKAQCLPQGPEAQGRNRLEPAASLQGPSLSVCSRLARPSRSK